MTLNHDGETCEHCLRAEAEATAKFKEQLTDTEFRQRLAKALDEMKADIFTPADYARADATDAYLKGVADMQSSINAALEGLRVVGIGLTA